MEGSDSVEPIEMDGGNVEARLDRIGLATTSSAGGEVRFTEDSSAGVVGSDSASKA